MASRNGLNPKIRGPKGVGYGRALPAPFSFGNGLCPDGNDDYLLIPGLVGKTWPIEGTIEFWGEIQSSRAQREFYVLFNDTSHMDITAFVSPIPGIESPSHGTVATKPPGSINYGEKHHYAFMWSASNFYAWSDAVTSQITSTGLTSAINLYANAVAISAQTDGSSPSNTKLDEFRIYNRVLSLSELILNDNSGVGNNPSTTENLVCWYQFEKFENLDFSVLQDGSDIRQGIRDMSGKNNHAQQFHMDTNPLSSTYALKPF
ncbi:MAG TPA: LamG-like jellyroll fold domain-containing protein [Mucilaginibacter sp.]|jgi:hypothetical protein|nr:LamG-like jellyroll fold domain-containing protein [Mucilaginibacter sp.]